MKSARSTARQLTLHAVVYLLLAVVCALVALVLPEPLSSIVGGIAALASVLAAVGFVYAAWGWWIGTHEDAWRRHEKRVQEIYEREKGK